MGVVLRNGVVKNVVLAGVLDQAEVPDLLAGLHEVGRFKIERDQGPRRHRHQGQAQQNEDGGTMSEAEGLGVHKAGVRSLLLCRPIWWPLL